MMKIKEWKYDEMMSKVAQYGTKWQGFDHFRRTDDEATQILRENGFVTYEGRFEILRETEKAVQISFNGEWTEWMPKSAVQIDRESEQEAKPRKAEEKKYRVKESWIFNLEAMNDHLHCIIYDVEEGKIAFPIEIAGIECKDEDDVERIREEADQLRWIAGSRNVTSREYGRIKEIVNWRVMERYLACLAGGMSEARAGECFADI